MPRLTITYASVLATLLPSWASWNLPYARPSIYDYSVNFSSALAAGLAAEPNLIKDEMSRAWAWYKSTFIMALLGASGAATLPESKNGPGTTNFVSDSVGPLINSAPARERLQLKPPVLDVTWDRPYDTGVPDSGRADFILYSVDADSSLIPVLADNGHGALVPCPATRCGQPFGPGSGPGAPSFTVVTDRPVKLTVTLFTNLGGYVNSLSGEITPAHLEMDTKGSPIGASQFRKDEQGSYAMRVTWNPRAHDGRTAGSGVYLAMVSVSELAKDAVGNTHSVAESRTFRFKVLDR